MQPKTIAEGIAAIIKYCREIRTDCTIRRYEKTCDIIHAYYEKSGQTYYNVGINNEIRDHYYGEVKSSATIGYQNHGYLFRILGMLDDYYNGHPFRDKYPFVSRYKHQLQPVCQQFADEFKESLTVRKNTVPVIYSIARDFFYYVQQLELSDMNSICHKTFYEFMMQEYQDHKGCMNNVIYVLRLICVFLKGKEFQKVPENLLPFSLPPSRKKIYPAFNTDDMENILSQPDKTTPSGKRDYAVLILASFTGMRAIDIANLKLADLNWKEMEIYFIQHKTGNGLSLPLESKAALAVSDYILNGRPESSSPYVFLTESKPFRKLNDKSSVANILNKHAKRAGIETSPHDGKSFHAFRRNMGIWLLDTSSNPELISQILGHQSQDVLKRYLPLSVSKLSMCALDFDAIEVQSEVYR
ncbi:MAG: tyrosine-type recombinase/integrase [Candidatus Cloacimonas acidaminovorans]|nr:tyrosine-type recombinase/integrase [Candidatus Cloacimonas acidaminovorans]